MATQEANMAFRSLSAEFDDDEVAGESMVQKLVAFGLARSTAQRLVGLPHVTPDMVTRWLRYCNLRGPDSLHNTNAFLIIRLNRNDFPPPSWGALRRLERRLRRSSSECCCQ